MQHNYSQENKGKKHAAQLFTGKHMKRFNTIIQRKTLGKNMQHNYSQENTGKKTCNTIIHRKTHEKIQHNYSEENTGKKDATQLFTGKSM